VNISQIEITRLTTFVFIRMTNTHSFLTGDYLFFCRYVHRDILSIYSREYLRGKRNVFFLFLLFFCRRCCCYSSSFPRRFLCSSDLLS